MRFFISITERIAPEEVIRQLSGGAISVGVENYADEDEDLSGESYGLDWVRTQVWLNASGLDDSAVVSALRGLVAQVAAMTPSDFALAFYAGDLLLTRIGGEERVYDAFGARLAGSTTSARAAA